MCAILAGPDGLPAPTARHPVPHSQPISSLHCVIYLLNVLLAAQRRRFQHPSGTRPHGADQRLATDTPRRVTYTPATSSLPPSQRAITRRSTSLGPPTAHPVMEGLRSVWHWPNDPDSRTMVELMPRSTITYRELLLLPTGFGFNSVVIDALIKAPCRFHCRPVRRLWVASRSSPTVSRRRSPPASTPATPRWPVTARRWSWPDYRRRTPPPPSLRLGCRLGDHDTCRTDRGRAPPAVHLHDAPTSAGAADYTWVVPAQLKAPCIA